MKEGETTEILTKDNQKFKGIILPSPDKNTIILKLESGYNIGIKNNNIKTYTSLGKPLLKEKKQTHKIEHNKNLKTILILHTGGTISSRVSYKTGAVSPGFSPEDILQMFPELKNKANIKSKLETLMQVGLDYIKLGQSSLTLSGGEGDKTLVI